MSTAVANSNSQKKPTQTDLATTRLDNLRGLLEKASSKLSEVAPKHLSVDRLVRLLLSACSRTPKILECTPASVLQFAMKCSETGLEPIGAGGAWPIPFENRKTNTVELQFIPDYRGLVNSAKQAGCIKNAFAEVVRQADEFSYELGMEPQLIHKPARGDRGQLEAAYCIRIYPDGSKDFVVMERPDIECIRRRSRAGTSGPWATDEAEMWKKTVVRRAMKPFAGASPHLDAAIEADDAATGVVESAREAVPMPKAIDETQAEQPPQDPPLDTNDELRLAVNDRLHELRVTDAAKVRDLLESVGCKKSKDLTEQQARNLLDNLKDEKAPE